MNTAEQPSVNALAAPLFAQLVEQAGRLRVAVAREASGPTVVDAGIAAPGSIAAGLQVAALCMGGLGEVTLAALPREGWPIWL